MLKCFLSAIFKPTKCSPSANFKPPKCSPSANFVFYHPYPIISSACSAVGLVLAAFPARYPSLYTLHSTPIISSACARHLRFLPPLPLGGDREEASFASFTHSQIHTSMCTDCAFVFLTIVCLTGLPFHHLINYLLLFCGGSAEVDAGCFDAFVPHEVCQERNIVVLIKEIFGISMPKISLISTTILRSWQTSWGTKASKQPASTSAEPPQNSNK